jgi:alpha-glucosidase (family GH31 glycosyl hydrolase)
MPWTYGDEGIALMRKYFTLHTQLIPYLYTYSWLAHRDSVPLLRPLYLVYPELEEAYRHSHEYFFGEEMLIAPVLGTSGEQTIYLPPGQWLDFFSGKRYAGGNTFTAHYAVDEIPVFVREGAIIPEQLVSASSDARPLDQLILNLYGSAAGRFDLYEDDGLSLGYEKGEYALTPLTYSTGRDGLHHLVIEPTQGTFQGQVAQRSYELRIHATDQPASLSVEGRPLGEASWDAAHATATVALPLRSIRDRIEVVWR